MAQVSGTTSDATPSVLGTNSYADAGIGVEGIANGAGASGMLGTSSGANSNGVAGESTGNYGYGIWGYATGTGGSGVGGESLGGDGYGVAGYAEGADSYAVYGSVYNDTSAIGVYGQAGESTLAANSYGIYGATSGPTSRGCYAGYFNGYISKSGSAFLIDHPLDPENKYLLHSCIESPDMKNVYDGVAVAGADGSARVTLPDYFEALNSDFRYQLTALGAPAPNLHVSQEISKGSFVVAGAAAGQRICWQVTGIRQDAFAKHDRLPVECDKPAAHKGLYKHPEAYGLPPEKGVHFKKKSQPRKIRTP